MTPPPQDTEVPSRYGCGLGLEEAKRVMAAAESEAIRRRWPVVVAIVDNGGHLVMVHRLDDAQLGSIAVAISKAETAVRFRRPTLQFQEAVSQGALGIRLLAIPGLLPLAGGVPLVRADAVVGAIGVSGMQSLEDALIADIGASALNSPAC